jgi:outer membrane protein
MARSSLLASVLAVALFGVTMSGLLAEADPWWQATEERPVLPPPIPTAPTPTMPPPLAPPEGIQPYYTPPEIAARELTLEECVAIALQNQPQIQARIQDYAASLERVNQALSPYLPQVSQTWNAFRLRTPSMVELPSGETTVSRHRTLTDLRFSASQLLFDFGRTWAATDAAKRTAESFKDEAELQKDLITLAVKESYFNLLLTRRLVTVNEQALDRAVLNLRSARGFFDVGTRPKSDVTRAEVDVANAQVNVIRALNAVNLARTALNTSMGIAVNTDTQIKDILTYAEYRVDPAAVSTEAIKQRPEARAARARAEGAEAVVRQMFRDFFPNLVASGSVGTATTSFEEFWSAGIELRWNIFDGGNKISRYKEAKILRDAALTRIRDTELTIWREVEQAYITLAAAEAQIGAARKAVESADENFRLSQGRFDAGVGTIIELTDAQLALTTAQSQEAQALADFRTAIARLERAVGKR